MVEKARGLALRLSSYSRIDADLSDTTPRTMYGEEEAMRDSRRGRGLHRGGRSPASRAGRLKDQPIRVEAVPEEEIEENQTIAPGNLTTLLNELGGLRVQTTVPALGGSELRLQGLRGRYTQILTDELPLYGSQPDGFSLMQVPP